MKTIFSIVVCDQVQKKSDLPIVLVAEASVQGSRMDHLYHDIILGKHCLLIQYNCITIQCRTCNHIFILSQVICMEHLCTSSILQKCIVPNISNPSNTIQQQQTSTYSFFILHHMAASFALYAI